MIDRLRLLLLRFACGVRLSALLVIFAAISAFWVVVLGLGWLAALLLLRK